MLIHRRRRPSNRAQGFGGIEFGTIFEIERSRGCIGSRGLHPRHRRAPGSRATQPAREPGIQRVLAAQEARRGEPCCRSGVPFGQKIETVEKTVSFPFPA
jgi:hypothetical protein